MIIGWNYDKSPNFSDDLLKKRAREAVRAISSRSPYELRLLIQDTRRLHLAYFENMTPPHAAFFAGNYRGANFPVLREYPVSFGPGLMGCPPRFVDAQMSSFASNIGQKIQELDIIFANDNKTDAEKLYRLSELACAIFVNFLNIHPYADGNGHMSRCIVFSLFSMYGYHLGKFPIHPRPSLDPPLHTLLMQYRAGNVLPLIRMMLRNISL